MILKNHGDDNAWIAQVDRQPSWLSVKRNQRKRSEVRTAVHITTLEWRIPKQLAPVVFSQCASRFILTTGQWACKQGKTKAQCLYTSYG